MRIANHLHTWTAINRSGRSLRSQYIQIYFIVKLLGETEEPKCRNDKEKSNARVIYCVQFTRRIDNMKAEETSVVLSSETAAIVGSYDDDLRIARKIAAGNRALFKQLYDRNINSLYNLALRLARSAPEAEDIVQESFIRAYQKIHLFAGRSSLSSWIYRICVNIGLEHLRRQKGTFEDLNDSNCGTTEPDQKKTILRRKLEKAIRNLPEGCRAVFILHEIEGFNHKEIAEQLKLAEGTSKSQLFKARSMLRRILTSREV